MQFLSFLPIEQAVFHENRAHTWAYLPAVVAGLDER
jgi:hypothetical protein